MEIAEPVEIRLFLAWVHSRQVLGREGLLLGWGGEVGELVVKAAGGVEVERPSLR